ncbi:MAG: NRDE family protein [Deltaproteobacteria bacterium]|nr:NRDE family protein [Deltaproteobacteria bacterium]
MPHDKFILSYKMHPKYLLVLAANRDEYDERLMTPHACWPAGT